MRKHVWCINIVHWCRMPLIRTSNFFFPFTSDPKPLAQKKGNYSRHRICDWRENLAHSSSPQHRTSDLMNRQMVLVSGCRCSWCLDHDSTRQRAAFCLFLGSDSSAASEIKPGRSHCKGGRWGLFFFILLWWPALKKFCHFTNLRRKTSEDTQLSFQTVIWFRKDKLGNWQRPCIHPVFLMDRLCPTLPRTTK